ncbi:MAG: hypothetical protein KJ052_02060 [Candidatus Hydrogenedentes bacterium]|nr:hypothetical protein [Candidatus Hydrogenedentota bacterium]
MSHYETSDKHARREVRNALHAANASEQPRLGWLWLLIMVLSLAGLGALAAFWMPGHLRQRELDKLAVVQERLFQAISVDNLDAALALCAEEEGHAELIANENENVYRRPEPPLTAEGLQDARLARLASFARLRKQLEEQGLDWTQARPLAFGGIRANVRVARDMRRSIELTMGNLYIESQGRIYRIEMSIRHVKRAWIIVDIWKWESLDIPAGAIRAHVEESVQEFVNTPEGDAEDTEFNQVKSLFINLQEPS